MKIGQRVGYNLTWLFAISLCLAAGCASKPKSAAKTYIVFPPPPDEPKIQFLTGFGAESDLATQSKWQSFVVGHDRIQRPIWKPYGITTAKGKLYICDTMAANVGTVDLVKHSIRCLKPEGMGAMQMPVGVAVDPDGTRYVTDTKRGQVLVYGSDGSLLAQIGKKSEMKPCGIAATPDRLYVADLANHCVRVYKKASRELLFTFPRSNPEEKARLFSPTNVAIDQQGRVCVADSGDYCVKFYDAEGNYLRTLGEIGLNPGRFSLPKGVGIDHDGRTYVIDAATAVAQVFDADGRLLTFFGEPKSSGSAGMYLPAGMAIDYTNVNLFQDLAAPGYKIEYLIFVTNQAGPNKVAVYGFLKKA